ncbi:hypothetical protein [Streptomyces genisteinicus]|uniref:Uncharacterized protein n=1 Tax=Streptomyces genisteinicus TaxID=2768068 RepID=A0A7H0HTQ4_9ACTN|nr:hypothetical protein [Streptomyces genisteinicus]QNP63920.1 hypothetical protein IAG43_13945 [Streptomyces genisteinicus]
MDPLKRTAWEAAALRLLGDVYAFAATGPRTQADWRDDVLAVLRRDVSDPQGCLTLDRDAAERDESHASFPFSTLTQETLAAKLFPVEPTVAVRLLITMTYEWGPVPAQTDSATWDDARTVLARYGQEISCYSNITSARTTSAPDLGAGVTGWMPLTEYDGDAGFVVVSPDEVGVFWSFDPI